MINILNVFCKYLLKLKSCFRKQVPTMKMHLFTLIQLMCLCFLGLISVSSISLTLPFFLIMMVPLRANFNYLFSPQELRAVSTHLFYNNPFYNVHFQWKVGSKAKPGSQGGSKTAGWVGLGLTRLLSKLFHLKKLSRCTQKIIYSKNLCNNIGIVGSD